MTPAPGRRLDERHAGEIARLEKAAGRALSTARGIVVGAAVILFVSAIVVTPLVVVFAGPDESERHGGRTTRLRPTRSYTTLRDVTQIEGSRLVG